MDGYPVDIWAEDKDGYTPLDNAIRMSAPHAAAILEHLDPVAKSKANVGRLLFHTMRVIKSFTYQELQDNFFLKTLKNIFKIFGKVKEIKGAENPFLGLRNTLFCPRPRLGDDLGLEAWRQLVEYLPIWDDHGVSPIAVAAEHGPLNFFKALADDCEPTNWKKAVPWISRDKDGDTPLSLATGRGPDFEKIAKTCIEPMDMKKLADNAETAGDLISAAHLMPWPESIRIWEKMIKDPFLGRANKLILARLYMENGGYDRALEIVNGVEKDGSVLFLKAQILVGREEHEEAKKILGEAWNLETRGLEKRKIERYRKRVWGMETIASIEPLEELIRVAGSNDGLASLVTT